MKLIKNICDYFVKTKLYFYNSFNLNNKDKYSYEYPSNKIYNQISIEYNVNNNINLYYKIIYEYDDYIGKYFYRLICGRINKICYMSYCRNLNNNNLMQSIDLKGLKHQLYNYAKKYNLKIDETTKRIYKNN